MQRFQDRFVLVTGAGNGLGKAIASAMAVEGAHVWLTDKDGAAVEQVAAEIASRGGKATAAAMDVTRGQDVSAVLRRIAAESGRLDVVVSNAGLNVRSDFRHLSEADWVRIREVNLDGVVRVARDAFELLRVSGRGVLVNVSSIMAARHLRQLAAYSVTKGAVTALTRSLAVEYAPFKIRVNSVAPGFVETALTERFVKNPMIRKALLDRIPFGRFVAAEEIAKAVLFLASDDAAMVTGAQLAVDGGMSTML
jgi:NAD(P)-dependent dehydrogenase (short-subunit alcohol dehydrogenase family)